MMSSLTWKRIVKYYHEYRAKGMPAYMAWYMAKQQEFRSWI